jgi:hypothetical protein
MNIKINSISMAKIILSFLVILSFAQAKSQTSAEDLQPDQKVIISLDNGEQYSGKFIRRDGESIVIQSSAGEFSLLISKIKSIRIDNYEGKYSFANPSDTRYFFGPSAIPLDKGKGYYQNIFLLFNFVNYGITENFSIGGGLEFISTFSAGQPIWFLTPKSWF